MSDSIDSNVPPHKVFRSDKEVADTLKALWEQQFKVVDLVIALATGTFLLLVNMLLSQQMETRLEGPGHHLLVARRLAFAAITLLGTGILSATLWRMLSLTWMEIECIGSREEANEYLSRIGVSGRDEYAFQIGPTSVKRRMWKLFQYSSGALILASWICILGFFWIVLLRDQP